ncbi:hypothetical protein ACJX0J_042000, partial [Zea mays]
QAAAAMPSAASRSPGRATRRRSAQPLRDVIETHALVVTPRASHARRTKVPSRGQHAGMHDTSQP